MIALMQVLYTILYALSLALLAPAGAYVLWRHKDRRRNFWQRVGCYSDCERRRLAKRAGPRCWVHAVSIGEMHVALHFITALRQRMPSLEVVLTTRTLEGRVLAEQRLPAGAELLQSPCDLPPSLNRAFGLIQPDFIILVELELWPNHLSTAARCRIPVFLINTPMSPSDARRYRLGGWFVRRLFGAPALICAQGQGDAERLRELGVPSERLQITGNLKYDVSLTNASREPSDRLGVAGLLLRIGVSSSQPILVAGSTHNGEESILFDLLAAWGTKSPRPFLILAPRHIGRAPNVAALGRLKDLTVLCRSEIGQLSPRHERPIDCLMLDTMGELPDFYKSATVIFVGGSLVGHGGHNIMEAAASGHPTLFGPNMENFRAIARQFLAEGGAVQVRNAGELRSVVERLLLDANERDRIAAAAQRVIHANTGATERTLELIVKSLEGELGR